MAFCSGVSTNFIEGAKRIRAQKITDTMSFMMQMWVLCRNFLSRDYFLPF